MTLLCFTGEQHGENFEKNNNLTEEFEYSVRVYESKKSSQFDFLQVAYRDTTTIMDGIVLDEKSNKYYMGDGKKRYLWLAARMGIPTVKGALGIEIVQTYNLLIHKRIVGW